VVIRFTWDSGNIALIGLYKLDGKLLIMLPGLIIDFPRKELPDESLSNVRM
jgi:hypothetical protein